MKSKISGGVIATFFLIAVVSCEEVKELATRQQCQCEKVSNQECQNHFNTHEWYGRFPNARGQDVDEAVAEFVHFYYLLSLDNYCSHMLYNLLCFHYFPKCEDNHPKIGARPCRETCNEAVGACAEHVAALRAHHTFPVHLNCSNFPPRSSNCSVETSQDHSCDVQCLTACPNASIHVEFVKKTGSQTIFEGFERNRSVEICLRLANVGSYNTQDTLDENVIVKLNGSGHAGASFQSVNIVFPVGSKKGRVRCAALEMVRSDRRRAGKFVRVSAYVLSPESAKIGGAASSTKDSITLKLQQILCPEFRAPLISQSRAPSEQLIPQDYCGRLHCNWRTNISRNTLTSKNLYSFVARVQVLSCHISMLEVHMLECHNLTCGACPTEMPACVRVAICRSCQMECVVGQEVIIAGRTSQSGSLYIGGTRKSGLFYDKQLDLEEFAPQSCKP